MAGQLTIDTLKASSGVLATQNGMTGIAKAWVQFVGSTAVINGSFNVSSVTRNSVGYYTVNFTTAMANANYSVAAISGTNGTYTAVTAANTSSVPASIAPTTSAFALVSFTPGVGYIDATYTSATVFGA